MLRPAFAAAVAASVLCVSQVTPASSLTLTTGATTCSTEDLTSSVACEGAFDGNDSNQNLDGLFPAGSWSELFKIDLDDNEISDSGNGLEITLSNLNDPDDATSGEWAVTSGGFDPLKQYMFVLKGGPTFAAYLMNFPAQPITETSGIWDTSGIFTGGQSPAPGPGLSHFTVYNRLAGDGVNGEIPLPAGIWLLLGGLGVVGALARRRAA